MEDGNGTRRPCQELPFDPQAFIASCRPRLLLDGKRSTISIRLFPTTAQIEAYYRRRKREIEAQKKPAPPSQS